MMIEFVVGSLLAVSMQAQDATAASATAATPAVIQASATTTEAAATEAPAADPDPVICRSRLVPSERVGARFRRVETCQTRSEWNNTRPRGR